MRVRELGTALIVALSSVLLVLGSLSISLVEFIPEATTVSTLALPPSPAPVTATATLLPTLTQDPNIPTIEFTITNTLSSVSCAQPSGWVTYIVQLNDTLDSLASRYRIEKTTLLTNNCLMSEKLISGTTLYVPLLPTSTISVCIPGGYVGWGKNYTVIKGDTLYSLSLNYYTTVDLLKQVNCKTTDQIIAGEMLWVPNIATRTPFPTPLPGVSPSPYPTDPLTQTALPFTATINPTNTAVPNTPTAMPTLTASPTALGKP